MTQDSGHKSLAGQRHRGRTARTWRVLSVSSWLCPQVRVRTTTTGQVAWVTQCVLTEPTSMPVKAPRPR